VEEYAEIKKKKKKHGEAFNDRKWVYTYSKEEE